LTPRRSTKKYYTIGEVAREVGVSPQAIRLWEQRGYLTAERSEGGHRIFQETALRRAVELKANVKRKQSNERVLSVAAQHGIELASTGARIRRARINAGLSQTEAAERIGISRTFLSAVERGESGVSVQIHARIADAFEIPIGGLSPASPVRGRVMRAADRPTTLLAGGVAWEELATAGHELEPAVLIVPASRDSGGVVVRSGEIFVFLLSGFLTFRFQDDLEATVLKPGDAIIVSAGTPHSWCNEGPTTTTCIWVEYIGVNPNRKNQDSLSIHNDN
jgi:transcriptional regulator with XRE-family HTH domain